MDVGRELPSLECFFSQLPEIKMTKDTTTMLVYLTNEDDQICFVNEHQHRNYDVE